MGVIKSSSCTPQASRVGRSPGRGKVLQTEVFVGSRREAVGCRDLRCELRALLAGCIPERQPSRHGTRTWQAAFRGRLQLRTLVVLQWGLQPAEVSDCPTPAAGGSGPSPGWRHGGARAELPPFAGAVLFLCLCVFSPRKEVSSRNLLSSSRFSLSRRTGPIL